MNVLGFSKKTSGVSVSLAQVASVTLLVAQMARPVTVSQTGLLDWFDPNQGLTVDGNGNVSGWINRADGERSVANTSVYTSVVAGPNGQMIRFNAPSDVGPLTYNALSASSLRNGMTLFVVFRMNDSLTTSGNTYQRLWMGTHATDNTPALYFHRTTGSPLIVKSNPVSSGARASYGYHDAPHGYGLGDVAVLTARLTPTAQELYFNGVPVSVKTTAVTPYYTFAGTTCQIGNSVKGDIGDVLVYDATATLDDLNATGVALAEAYGEPWTVSGGRLNVGASTITIPLTVAAGAQIAGTGTLSGLLRLESGASLVLAGGAETAGLNATGGVTCADGVAVVFEQLPESGKTYALLSYGAGVATGGEHLSIHYRGILSNDMSSQAFTFAAGEYSATRTWAGGDGVWSNACPNWLEGDQRFYVADHVVFETSSAAAAIDVPASVKPTTMNVNSDAPYTFTGDGPLQIGGNLEKRGEGKLTFADIGIVCDEAYVRGGLLRLADGASLNGAVRGVGRGISERGVLCIDTSSTNTFGSTTGDNNIPVGYTRASGAVRQSAGRVQWGGATGYNYVYLGEGAGGYGAYRIDGGSLGPEGAGSANLSVGYTSGGLGVFEQYGGDVAMNRHVITAWDSNSRGMIYLEGGTFSMVGSPNEPLHVCRFGTGVFNLGDARGGGAVLVTDGGIRFGTAEHSTAVGDLNLNGGTVRFTATTAGIYKLTNVTSRVHLNGAVLQAAVNDVVLICGTGSGHLAHNAVNVFNGGVTVDTQAHAASIAADMARTAGNGIYRDTAFAGTAGGEPGAGYIAPPLVSVTSDGQGTGAQVRALVDTDAGLITGFAVTNPGQGYEAGETLTLTLAGGGCTTAAAPYTYALTAGDLQPNGSGGLTKEGSGTLSLSGTNTYAGETVVAGGALRLTHPECLSGGTALKVRAGATLVLDFHGTATVHSLQMGDTLVKSGVFSAATHPEYIEGTGFLRTLQPTPKGTIIRLN